MAEAQNAEEAMVVGEEEEKNEDVNSAANDSDISDEDSDQEEKDDKRIAELKVQVNGSCQLGDNTRKLHLTLNLNL